MNKIIKVICLLLVAVLFSAMVVGCSQGDGDKQGKEEKILDVILLGGQSNALGLSVWEGEDVVYEDVGMFCYGEGVSLLSPDLARWKKTSNGYGLYSSRFGPEVGIAQVCSEHYRDSDRDIGIIKYSWGAQKLYDYFLSPTSVKQKIGKYSSAEEFSDDDDEMTCAIGFWNTIKTVRAAEKQALKNGYDKVNIIAMCWMQGESDACEYASATIYDKLLANFMLDIRTYLSVDELPFSIGQITPPAAAVYASTITEKQLKVIEEDGHAEFVRTEDLKMNPNDVWHYDTSSMKELGKRFGESVFRLVG